MLIISFPDASLRKWRFKLSIVSIILVNGFIVFINSGKSNAGDGEKTDIN